MRKFKSTKKIIAIIFVLITTIVLSGCVRKADDVYFLRGIVSEYGIVYQDGDNDKFVTKDLILATSFQGADITWHSNNEELVATDGKVTLPNENQTVTLTATFKVGKYESQKKYVLQLISQESIENAKYIEALNKILLLETRNNEPNYLSAKEALNQVSLTHENHQTLLNRFNDQEQIHFLEGLVKNYINLPTTDKFNHIKAIIDGLPEHNQYVITYKDSLLIEEPHLAIGDQVLALINNKNETDYNDVKVLVESLPDNLPSKTNQLKKLSAVRKYLDNNIALELNTLTQTELEAIIVGNALNDILVATDIDTLNNQYQINQNRLFNYLPDKGYQYIDDKIDGLSEEKTILVQDKAIMEHLITSYGQTDRFELDTKYQLLLLSKEISSDLITAAKTSNNQIANETLKAENAVIINDYELVTSLQQSFIELMDLRSGVIDFDALSSKIDEVKLAGQNLVIEANIAWFNNQFALYDATNKVIISAGEILEVPFTQTDETTNPLVAKISQTKVLNNQTILNNQTALKTQLTKLIESNTQVRLIELKAINEANPTEENRILLGQLLGQTGSKEYDTYLIRAYKDGLDSESRLSKSALVVIKILVIFIAIVIFLVMQAMTADYAAKKGYEGLRASLIALIPIGGWLYFYNQPKRRNISASGIKQVYKPQEIFAKVVIYGQIVIISFIVIVPIIYIFGMAFSNMKTDIPNQIWPANPNWESFKFLFNETNFKKWWINTVMIAAVNMLIGTVLITGAAYVFARFSFKGKKAGLLTILVLQSFPSFMGLIAMYVLFWKFGLLGQPLALTILYIGGGIPGNIWLIKGFMDQIPKDLDESAMIDGANKLQIFFKIIMPLAVPILTFVAVGMFMAPWMDYMLPGYLLNIPHAGAPADFDITQQWTLAVGLFKLINDPNTLNYSAFAAGALIVGLPITILYMFFQKYLIEGIMAGATKG